MLSFHKPDQTRIDAFLTRQTTGTYSYTEIGASQESPPPGYAVDHHRVCLGTGQSTFLAGCEALRRWEMFNLGWVSVQPPHTPIAEGRVVAIIAHVFGCWFLNACRIVYIREEEGPIETFGFAYGTLHDHMAQGEERFTIEWNHADDCVWYDLFAFSKPHHILFRLGYPIARRVQRRFALDSLAAMMQAVPTVSSGENASNLGHIQVIQRRTDPGELVRWGAFVGGIGVLLAIVGAWLV
jgi:uncharacterized protein (UPF0548 family)